VDRLYHFDNSRNIVDKLKHDGHITIMQKPEEIYDVAAKLEALGNETRLQVFQLLVRAGHAGMPVGALQKTLAVPGSTLSHHISRLVSVGLVHQKRESRSLICGADFDAMTGVVGFLTRNCCAMEDTADD